MKKTLNLLVLTVLIAGCGQGAMSTDTSALEARSDAWEAALNADDLDALVALYTDDARLLPPDGKMTSGRDGVRDAFGGMIDAGIGGTTTIIEATVAGDVGYIVGTFALVAGEDAVGTGKYIETWRLGDDGLWYIANDIYNNDPSDQPKMAMSHIMITHSVDDGDVWASAWSGDDSRKDLFMENGAAHVHAFRSAENPNETGLVVAVEDMDVLFRMLESEEGLAAAAEDGVRRDTIEILDEVD